MNEHPLGSGQAIRERAGDVFEAAARGALAHFALELGRLPELARQVAALTRARYPSLAIPAHSRFGHFDAGGVKRTARVAQALTGLDPRERARRLTDLVLVSVLLDAGAGSSWRYREPASGLVLGRSEGLALASLAWIEGGGLSSRARPYEVDAEALSRIDEAAVARAFQVAEDNPLVGCAGRASLLRALGEALGAQPELFGAAGRPGGLVDALAERARGGVLPAPEILAAILRGLGGIWPGRLSLDGVPLGDVWQHPAAGGEGPTRGLVPFHKLSQWLSYSLLHPLEVAGLRVTQLDALTGLAEYRNGGLFVDGGALVPKHADVLGAAHEVGSELVVEWRALTVVLLDRLAPLVRAELGLTAERLPLAAVLEGGTWALGRELAKRARADGGPPIRVISDGTVF
jgi:hypothetical protein